MYFIKQCINSLFPSPYSYRELESLPQSLTLKTPKRYALYNYENASVRSLVKYIKKYHDKAIALNLAELMCRKLIPKYIHQLNKKNILIVPVPVSKKRYRERGFNQVSHLSFLVAKKMNILFLEKAIIKSETRKQSLLNYRERFFNVRGSFSISKKYQQDIKTKDIIIIDDLITTGATIDEIERILIKAGVRSVWAMSIAH